MKFLKDLSILALVVLAVVIATMGWRRLHPAPIVPEIPVEVVVKPKQDITQAATVKRLQSLIDAQRRDIQELRATFEKAKAQAEAKVDIQVGSALKGGPDALAALATAWWSPGSLERLKGTP